MSELEMKSEAEAEAEEFTDELSDEALDREREGVRATVPGATAVPPFCCFVRPCR